MTAIDIETGSSRWHHQTESAELSSPAISGEFLIVGSKDGRLRARSERATGNCVWAHTVGTWVASVHYGPTVRERPTPPKCVVTLVVLSALGGSRDLPPFLIRRSQEGVYPGLTAVWPLLTVPAI